jgi:fructose-specific phosphotransferase system IIA component
VQVFRDILLKPFNRIGFEIEEFMPKNRWVERLVWLILLFPAITMASDGSETIVHRMSMLVFQLSVILFAARLAGTLFKKLKFPSVLGELIAGIILGPSLLGSIPIPFLFENGLFPQVEGALIPVQPELYAISTIGSIVLLFLVGLETDLKLFLQFSVAGVLVGFGGVIFSFLIGAYTTAWWLHLPLGDPRVLLMGVISTATSVGITIRVLSEKKKVGSPEGMTILAGAVVDDILGIILLSVVLGIATLSRKAGQQANQLLEIGMLIFRALGVWLGFTAVGLLLSHKIGSFLKFFKNIGTISVLALGLALFLSGIFEKAGLAMIIGAYVTGLTLSRTDLAYVIENALHPVYEFFVPIFFVVMGMLVNIKELISPKVLTFGLIFTIGAVVAKIVGCGIPTFSLKFNFMGAFRIGVGMVPRGEVALIVAGIGLSSGFLDQQLFGAAIFMTLLTTIIAPPVLNVILTDRKGTLKELEKGELVGTDFNMASPYLVELLSERIVQSFVSEGYYVNTIEDEYKIYHFRREKTAITLFVEQKKLRFENNSNDTIFVKNIVYENLVRLNGMINEVKDLVKPEMLKQELIEGEISTDFDVKKVLSKDCISLDLHANSKNEVIKELIDILYRNGNISNPEAVLEAVMERENILSTGMQNGIALPHGKTDSVEKLVVAVGIHRKGVDFQSLDGMASQIFICAIAPEKIVGPHIRFIAHIGALLNTREKVDELLACSTEEEVYRFFTEKKR